AMRISLRGVCRDRRFSGPRSRRRRSSRASLWKLSATWRGIIAAHASARASPCACPRDRQEPTAQPNRWAWVARAVGVVRSRPVGLRAFLRPRPAVRRKRRHLPERCLPAPDRADSRDDFRAFHLRILRQRVTPAALPGSQRWRLRFASDPLYLISVTCRSEKLITCRAMDPNTSSLDPMPRVPMTMPLQFIDLAHWAITDGT